MCVFLILFFYVIILITNKILNIFKNVWYSWKFYEAVLKVIFKANYTDLKNIGLKE